MRQAGIIAAGALHALRHHSSGSPTITETRAPGAGLADARPWRSAGAVQTNIVLAAVTDGRSAAEVVAELGRAGVLCGSLDEPPCAS